MKRLIVLAGLPLAACAALGGGRPQIENRFARQLPSGGATAPLVTLDVATTAVDDTPVSIPITALGDRAQAALIAKSPAAPVAIKAPDKPVATFAVHDHVTRHITVAVRPAGFLDPGDRVDAIRVMLEVAPRQAGDWAITSWTQASNGQTTIDLGHLSETDTSKIAGSLAAGTATTVPTATLAAERSVSRTRDAEIRDTTDFDAAVDADGHAWLDETAGWRASLAHTVSMDAVVTAGATDLHSLRLVTAVYADRKDAAAVPGDARLVETTVYAPLALGAAPVCGHARLTYRIRHIVNPDGRRTFTEADDDVVFQTGTAEASFLLAPAPFEPAYVIAAGDEVLHYRVANGRPAMLAFATLDDAGVFRDWLRRAAAHGGQVANATIGVDRGGELQPLTPATLALLVARIANPDAAVAAAAGTRGCRTAAAATHDQEKR